MGATHCAHCAYFLFFRIFNDLVTSPATATTVFSPARAATRALLLPWCFLVERGRRQEANR